MNESKERPILFNDEMVRAILAGNKTQTRRIIKPQPHFERGFTGDGMAIKKGETTASIHSPLALDLCKYGRAGDRLWVRESFWGCDFHGYGDTPCVIYDDEFKQEGYFDAPIRPYAPKFGRIPSIHMPRALSRITLEIIRVRIERLNDISPEDAIAEGIKYGLNPLKLEEHNPIYIFKCLWESINGAGSWAENPYVWVIGFKVIKSS